MRLTESEKKAIKKFISKVRGQIGIRDIIIIVMGALTGISMTTCSVMVGLNKANRIDQEQLNSCLNVAQQCSTDTHRMDAEIKAIFQATKRDLCPPSK